MGNVYFIYSANDNMCKIGYTKSDVYNRLKQLNTGNSSKLILLGYIHGDMKLERNIRNRLHHLKENLEWVRIDQGLIDWINDHTLTATYCEYDESRVMRVYKKMIK